MICRFLLLICAATVLLLNLTGCTSSGCGVTERERFCHAAYDVAYLEANELPPGSVLDLDEIIAIALQNDLDLEVLRQRIRIQREVATADTLSMLPELNLEADISQRSNSAASTSRTVRTNGGLSPASVSSDKTNFQASVGVLWNLLDFGLSYYQARQSANRINLDYLEYQRAKQNIILRVVRSYWKAASAKFAIDTAIPLIGELREQREKLRKQIDEGIYLSDVDAYGKLARYYQREIQLKGFNDRTDSSDPTQGYEKEYENALVDLASAMGMRPGTTFEIVFDNDFAYEVDIPSETDLENIALMKRTELYQNDTQLKISKDEVKKAILRQFPTARLFDTEFYNQNRFLVHRDWLTAGAGIAWDLLSIPYYHSLQQVAEDEVGLVRRDRLVLSMGILVQVNLGRILYEQNKEQYLLSLHNSLAQEKLMQSIHLQAKLGKRSESDDINARIDAALAKVNTMKVYAELQNSVEFLNNAIGLPRYFKVESNSRQE
ncbi:TolC family protein [Estrella lausannensis]|uniref:Outer membrane efflux protein n=1 Tax=Estrella lausannensis TaxID=483423 RepID=A0A0H5DQC3_9BACT|nr:TolC family protein [Estrella lausannensis]CRX38712.1 Outer membrane efflux protein [Estrella lausannensis]